MEIENIVLTTRTIYAKKSTVKGEGGTPHASDSDASAESPVNPPQPRPPINARYIKFIRAKYRWTQRQLAKYLNVHHTTIPQWEKGHYKPTKKHLIAALYRLGENKG